MDLTETAISHTLCCARYFRRLGLCPIPSRMDKKAPILKLRSLYDGWPVSEYVYTKSYWRTTNMQVLTGTTTPTETKIVVVDIDGNESWTQWKKLCAEHHSEKISKTWFAQSNRGWHIYYCLPKGVEECPSGILWGIWDTTMNSGRGGWQSNCEIRLLADRSLVTSPPSYHVSSGAKYTFLDGLSPKEHLLPIMAPEWLLAMPRLKPPVFHQENSKPLYQPKLNELPDDQYSRGEVLNAVADKLKEVVKWGVVFPTYHNRGEWLSCFVPDREDPKRSSPSGSFNLESGCLYDFATGLTKTFFDIGVATGRFATWQECCNHLGEIYIGNKSNG